MSANHYTYRITWSPQDQEFVATAAEFPHLSWLEGDPGAALTGLVRLIDEVLEDMRATGEAPPVPLADRPYSGKFNVRVPSSLHRELAIAAAEQGISLNRLVSDRLAHAG